MLIGILSDVHGNDVALRECLEFFSKERVQKLLILGDLVGYYYNVTEVLNLLEEWDVISICGNHERLLFQSIESPDCLAAVTKKYGHGIMHAIKTLSHKHLAWLRNLPEVRRVELEGVRFVLSHGSPHNPNAYVYPDAPLVALQEIAQTDADFVLMGHTHRPFVVQVRNCGLLNPGSVGQPRDFGNLASCIVLNTENRAAVFHRLRFSTCRLKSQVAEMDPDSDYLVEVLGR